MRNIRNFKQSPMKEQIKIFEEKKVRTVWEHGADFGMHAKKITTFAASKKSLKI
jgi:hypothetical protein